MTVSNTLPATRADLAPAFQRPTLLLESADLRRQLGEAFHAWLTRSPSAETRDGYSRDLFQFLDFAGIPSEAWERLAEVRPASVAAFRDHLLAEGQSNTTVGRKLSVLRSLYSYLRAYGYTGANPADTAFVAAPRRGKGREDSRHHPGGLPPVTRLPNT